MLRVLCDRLGFSQDHFFLDIYADLQRHIFIDGAPTPYVLHGADSCGIPQGCPTSCFFAHLVDCYWSFTCMQTGCAVIAYLDDWMVIGDSWADLNAVLTQALLVCNCVGSNINLTKTHRAVALPPGQRVPHCRGGIAAIPMVSSFKYLGVDIAFRKQTRRLAAARRVADYCRRAELMRSVHFT
jgi:hypothetical protein